LENAVGHARMMSLSGTIDDRDLPGYLWDPAEPPAETEGLPGLKEQERLLLQQALDQAKGNRSAAARSLRIGPDTMRYRMKKFGLE
jgi:DNA-binding NtrC family response regulator